MQNAFETKIMRTDKAQIHVSVILLVAMTSAILLSGCSAPNYVWPAYDKITLYANKNVNPDANNRPSPIQVKIYELAARTTFDNLDFHGAFVNGNTLLSDELISEEAFVIQPNETLTHKVVLDKTATHIAIIAAYRNIDEARWKHIYPIKYYGYYNHTIELTHDALEVKKSERQNTSEDAGQVNHQRKQPYRSSNNDSEQASENFGTKKEPELKKPEIESELPKADTHKIRNDAEKSAVKILET